MNKTYENQDVAVPETEQNEVYIFNKETGTLEKLEVQDNGTNNQDK